MFITHTAFQGEFNFVVLFSIKFPCILLSFFDKHFRDPLTAFHGEFAELLVMWVLVELHRAGQQQGQPGATTTVCLLGPHAAGAIEW